MKFTRSLAAKAMARAKVPTSTTTLSEFTLNTIRTCSKSAEAANEPSRISPVWPLIHARVSGVMNEAPLEPLMRMK